MKPIQDQLRERYPSPEWALFFEVANGLGAVHRRYADAIAMSLFPSRGLDFHGLEIKRDRGDWLRELKKPQKAESIASYCDYWWIVVSDEKIAQKDEVPRNWGLLVSNGEVLRQVKSATRLESKPLDRKFAGALLRRADEWAQRQINDSKRLVDARAAGVKEGKEEAAWEGRQAKEHLRELQARLTDFEKVSGVQISRWSHGNVGEAVKAFLYAQEHEDFRELEKTANLIEASVRALRERAEILKKARPPKEAVPGPGA